MTTVQTWKMIKLLNRNGCDGLMWYGLSGKMWKTNHTLNDGIPIATKWLRHHMIHTLFHFVDSECWTAIAVVQTLILQRQFNFSHTLPDPFIRSLTYSLPFIRSSSLHQMPPASTLWSAPWFSISGIQIYGNERQKNIFSPAPFDEIYISLSLIV